MVDEVSIYACREQLLEAMPNPISQAIAMATVLHEEHEQEEEPKQARDEAH